MIKKITKVAIAAAIMTSTFVTPAKADDVGDGIKSVGGILVGMPVGAISGLWRGSASKGVQYADEWSGELGDNVLGKFITNAAGPIIGGVTGGVTGLIRGMTDGIVKGADDPFSLESAALSGNFLDYDPYDINL